MPADRCPTCHSTDLRTTGIGMTPSQAADHLVPPRRDPDRNAHLRLALVELWGPTGATIRSCSVCGFGFADPYVAGSPDVYNLMGGGAQHYPRDRFEYATTLDALRSRGGVDRVLEIGGGSGAFAREVAEVAGSVMVTEYDDSAVQALRAIAGLDVHQGDFRQLELADLDAVCLFQVLEHLDDLDGAFTSFRSMLREGGEVYIGVPNHERTELQESLTRFLDMPPVHIGRWTTEAMAAIAGRHGFAVVDERVSDDGRMLALWRLAGYRLEHRTRDPGTIVSHVERIPARPVRGVLKRVLTLWDLARLARLWGEVPPDTRWFRLRRQ